MINNTMCSERFMVRTAHHQPSKGFTYIELMIALAMASAIILGLSGVIGQTLHSSSTIHAKNTITRDAHFTMAQMITAVQKTHYLILPLNDNPDTNWPENIREQTKPASAPIGDSIYATAVLAVTLARDIDLDKDGTPDADNDGDGRFDEDLGVDNNNDGFAGIYLIDDNGDGTADNSIDANPNRDNDEDNNATEETRNNLDDDGDGNIDEDLSSDENRDGQDGIAGVDDDGDGSVDEGNLSDDDEDGSVDEDYYDVVVFYLSGNQLIKRTPVPWDTNSDTSITGADFIESPIADNVTHFRVERPVTLAGSPQLIDITLQLTSPDTGEVISLNTQVRVGGAL